MSYSAAEAKIENEAQYRAALKLHDWYFEYSCDGRVYKIGQAERAALQSAQKEFDADYSIWNSFAMPEYRRNVLPVVLSQQQTERAILVL